MSEVLAREKVQAMLCCEDQSGSIESYVFSVLHLISFYPKVFSIVIYCSLKELL